MKGVVGGGWMGYTAGKMFWLMLADWSGAFKSYSKWEGGQEGEWEELNVENMRMLAEKQAAEQRGIKKGMVWHGSVKPV